MMEEPGFMCSTAALVIVNIATMFTLKVRTTCVGSSLALCNSRRPAAHYKSHATLSTLLH